MSTTIKLAIKSMMIQITHVIPYTVDATSVQELSFADHVCTVKGTVAGRSFALEYEGIPDAVVVKENILSELFGFISESGEATEAAVLWAEVIHEVSTGATFEAVLDGAFNVTAAAASELAVAVQQNLEGSGNYYVAVEPLVVVVTPEGQAVKSASGTSESGISYETIGIIEP